MSKKKKVSNKKKKSSIKKPKSCKQKMDTKSTPVKPLTYVNGEAYPKLIFKQTLWTRLLRFLGLDS